MNVHPNAFDLSADVQYFCIIKPRFSKIYIYTRKSVIRSTPKKRSDNVDTTNWTDFGANVRKTWKRNECNDFKIQIYIPKKLIICWLYNDIQSRQPMNLRTFPTLYWPYHRTFSALYWPYLRAQNLLYSIPPILKIISFSISLY